MAVMKFEMFVAHSDGKGETWVESYDQPYLETEAEVRNWAHRTIERFNATLRPGEKPRDLLEVTISDEPSDNHSWEKTNLVTISDKDGLYDTAQCTVCGITARRYGLGGYTRDTKFRAGVFDSCARSKVFLEKRRIKRERSVK
jgi:hypothetical protein